MSNTLEKLTAARLTPGGRGAVATIRVCVERLMQSSFGAIHNQQSAGETGNNAFARLNELFVAANGLPISEQREKRIFFGQWGKIDGEDLVACRVSPMILELHCHGGEAAVQRILRDLATVGCDITDWRQQTAYVDGMVESECLDMLSRATTWRTTKIILDQANGLLKSTFHQLIVENSTNPELCRRRLDELLEWADFGRHLSTSWKVVLTGRPNVGKSSLMNALLGYTRAIVFDEPGTTRDVVTGETAFDGWPFLLADTAGIRDDAVELEAAGIARARDQLSLADLQLVVIDINQPPTVQDQLLLREWPDALIVAHKSDLENCWAAELPSDAVPVSSVTGKGLDQLQRAIVSRVVRRAPEPETAIPICERQIRHLRNASAATTNHDREQALQRLFMPD